MDGRGSSTPARVQFAVHSTPRPWRKARRQRQPEPPPRRAANPQYVDWNARRSPVNTDVLSPTAVSMATPAQRRFGVGIDPATHELRRHAEHEQDLVEGCLRCGDRHLMTARGQASSLPVVGCTERLVAENPRGDVRARRSAPAAVRVVRVHRGTHPAGHPPSAPIGNSTTHGTSATVPSSISTAATCAHGSQPRALAAILRTVPV